MNVTPNVIYGHGEYSLKVQWETPKFDGGVDIEKYTVVLSNGDDVTSVKIIKNEVGCRDDTVPKTVETRRHCEED